MEEDSLLEIQRVLKINGGTHDVAELLTELAASLGSIQTSAHVDDVMDVDSYEKPWRRDVKTVTQAIVEPDDLPWMDDDESLSDTHYISRAITDIETRFERYDIWSSGKYTFISY